MHPTLLLLLVGCGPSAVTCDAAPTAAYAGGTAFEERTDAWGLASVHGGRMLAGDLDGDGYPDLIVTELFAGERDAPEAGTQNHFVLFNRPAGDGRTFEDGTVASGLLVNRDGTVGTAHSSYSLGDVDNDGDLDVFAGMAHDDARPTPSDCSEIYLNDGGGHFTLAPASDVCVARGYPTAGSAFTDVDGDGVLDLWITGFYEEYGLIAAAQDQLYRGNGDGTFESVTREAGLLLGRATTLEQALARTVRRPAYGATACDLDGDTFPELLATNYGRSWNQLWRNHGDGTFTEEGEVSGFAGDDNVDYRDNGRYACWHAARGTAQDPEPTVPCEGWDPDYWTPGYDDQPARNNGNSFTTVCGDLDNDGDLDLLTAEIAHRWAGASSDRTTVLFNDGDARFTRAEPEAIGMDRQHPARGDWNEGDLYAAFADFDNDGWKDVFLASSDYEDTHMWLWRQASAGMLEDVSEATGMDQPWPAGLAIADFDRDGDLDVVTGSSTARSGTPWTSRAVHLHESVRDPGNWLRISGLPAGTRVEVDAGGHTQVQEVSGGYGTFGMLNDVALHFGLGDTCVVDAVRATRPGGTAKDWPATAGNTTLDLTW
ncbi:MAG: hypothetical protein RLZZ299_1037 [Pseudomonadota bacterium]